MEPIQVAGMGPAWGLPSPSPFCLKLETWLRIEGLAYTRLILNKPPQSRTGKVPYLVRPDGSTLADSNIIIESIAKERGIDPGYGATPDERARAHAILRTIEESLYFCAVWERWVLPECWPVTRGGYFGQLPPGLRSLVAALVRRKIRQALHGQGISRHEPDRVTALGTADVKALSVLLGDRPFFTGSRPGVVDASAYGTLANFLGFPCRTPLKSAVEAQPNLIAFCNRMKEAYWNDSTEAADGAALKRAA